MEVAVFPLQLKPTLGLEPKPDAVNVLPETVNPKEGTPQLPVQL